MNDVRSELDAALADFLVVAKLARAPIQSTDIVVEYLPAPHRPSGLPPGKMAVYMFRFEQVWLKIGKAGPSSGPRYMSQHYTGSAMSTLAGSLNRDSQRREIPGFTTSDAGSWIKRNTDRVNILLPASHEKELLSLLEAFLHLRFRPRYEGFEAQP
jgi:hypothetical protein